MLSLSSQPKPWIWRSSSQEGHHHHGDDQDHPRTFDRRRRPDQKAAMLLLPHSRCAEMGASSHRHGDQIPLRSVFKRTSSDRFSSTEHIRITDSTGKEKVARDVEIMQERVAEKSFCVKNDMETSQSSVTDSLQNLDCVSTLVSNENKPSSRDDHDDDIDEPTTENISGIGSKLSVLDTKSYHKLPGDLKFFEASGKFKSEDYHDRCETKTIEEAMTSLERMPDEPLPTYIFIPILKDCRRCRALSHAQRLHIHMCYHGFETHGVLRNILMTIYVDSGCLLEAQQLVDRRGYLDEHSWNSLVQGYNECGNSEHAFKLYEMMQEQFVHTRRYILMALLKTFSSLECLEKGQELHAKIVKEGFEKDLFFCNTLLDMYLKTDCVIEAQDIVDEQPLKDIVLWGTLINGYTELGLYEEALKCWDQIVLEGMGPDAVVSICILKVCSALGDLERGWDVHRVIVEKMLEKEPMIGNALVHMYAKCGSLEDSQEVFDNLPFRDVVAWTSLITGYAEHECAEDALKLFERMKDDGITPNYVTFLCILKVCGSMQAVDRGQTVHAEIVKEEYENHPLISTALVDMYGKCNLLREARFIHDSLKVKTVISWTSLIAGYAEHGLVKETFHCFKKMQSQGIVPNNITFLCTLKACVNEKCINRGRQLHADIIKIGFERDLLISTTMVDMYGKCGSCVEAQFMFDKLGSPNIISWTALIAGYSDQGRFEEALHASEKMQMENVFLEDVVYSYILTACGNLGDVHKGYSIHTEVSCKGFEKRKQVCTALVSMYAKNGFVHDAKKMFDSFQNQDVASWNLLISSFSDCGLCAETMSCLQEMQMQQVSPDISSWMYSIKACHFSGFSDIGRSIHLEIVKRGLEMDPLMGRTLLDMYAMHDLFADAWKVFDNLPSRDLISWSKVISSVC